MPSYYPRLDLVQVAAKLLQLGASQYQALTAKPTSRRVHLLSLPTEVLIFIMRFCDEGWHILSSYVWNNDGGPFDLQSLCRTCRRLRDIGLPILYRQVCLSERNPKQAAAFLRGMRKTPHLALLIQRLDVSMPAATTETQLSPQSIPGADFQGKLEILPFRNLTVLALRNGIYPRSINKIPVGENVFPELMHCFFSFGWHDCCSTYQQLPISDFIPFFNAPKLQRITIGGERLHVTSRSGPNDYARYNSPKLADIELSIGCFIDKNATRELLALRNIRAFYYEACYDVKEGSDFNDHSEYLSPSVEDLTYHWRENCSAAMSRYPDISEFSLVTSLTLSAPILAALSTESESYQPSRLICDLPPLVQHLGIHVNPSTIHRRQFYGLVTYLVESETVVPSLNSLNLVLGLAEIPPDKLYWNNRLVGEKERTARGIRFPGFYGAHGETAEHNSLRKSCASRGISLHSSYVQTLQEGVRKFVAD